MLVPCFALALALALWPAARATNATVDLACLSRPPQAVPDMDWSQIRVVRDIATASSRSSESSAHAYQPLNDE